ncbi:hypothetical protein G6Z94_04120 [Vibrio aestuarianus]|uniref:hypothetical protein n=1 Tax=Vibrio aestuarianus TaxID=28171 RepID=UPI001593DEA8|nr:hypothetical protein [Vibrio aestuarianus]NGZ16560.1 hypothetical protein [Vibrio aestuarianus]
MQTTHQDNPNSSSIDQSDSLLTLETKKIKPLTVLVHWSESVTVHQSPIDNQV